MQSALVSHNPLAKSLFSCYRRRLNQYAFYTSVLSCLPTEKGRGRNFGKRIPGERYRSGLRLQSVFKVLSYHGIS
ncbi:hypothetical protein KQX54_011025 [Cotesia glomerata]|uniref:Uncharacterized protein n=1 Tax=Cotesia glomerata TaxID=32391 RepID=A0AAV7ILS1_COTGL|nr:hypothetical protein KQX54_011025 [Cotesia glomerata]